MQDVVPHKAKSLRRSQGFDDNITEEEARQILAQAVPDASPTETFVTGREPPPWVLEMENNTATTAAGCGQKAAEEDTQPPVADETMEDEVRREIIARG